MREGGSTAATRQSVALVVTAGMLLGTAGTAAALGPTAATPVALGGLRLAVGAALLLTFLPWLGGAWASIPRLLRRPTIWVMGVGAGGFQPLFFAAVERSGVALATLLAIGAAPVVTGLLSWAVLRKRPTAAWAMATTIAVIGLTLLSWDDLGTGDGLGLVMAASAGVCMACYVVAAKAELDRGGNVVELPGVAYLLGSLLLLPSLVQQPLSWIATPDGLALTFYLGGITMALANVVQIRGLRGLPPAPAVTLLLAEPVTATMLGIMALGETITPRGAVGLVIVLTGLVLQGHALGTPADEPAPQPAL